MKITNTSTDKELSHICDGCNLCRPTFVPSDKPFEPKKACLHANCSDCHGSGMGKRGPCVHMISCPCENCSITM